MEQLKRTICRLSLGLLVIYVLTLRFDIRPVRASSSIYIRADGRIDPLTANITTTDQSTYIFTGNNYEEIIVERDNIVVDGAGYALQGAGPFHYSKGICLSSRSNVTIKNMEIKAFTIGVWLNHSSHSIIQSNIITESILAIKQVNMSSNNSVCENKITGNDYGIELSHSSNNTINENTITENSGRGIRILNWSSNNIISGNIITKNEWLGVGIGYYSNHSSVSGNKIADNGYGVMIALWSSNNTFYENDITDNWGGFFLGGCSNNIIYHNNFIGNAQHVVNETSDDVNFWDDGYPSGGNYWSDYEERYPDAVEINDSGIWDTPYVICKSNQDNYPLMKPQNPLFGDMNYDFRIDMKDIGVAALALGSHPTHPRWDNQADINQDGRVDMKDLVLIASNFGKTSLD